MIAWLYVLLPLLLFLVGYIVETYVSFARLKNKKKDNSYLDATWEVTHTFLVVSVACFVGFFSTNLIELADAAFYGMFLVSIFVALRTVTYIYLFYIREPTKRGVRNWIDVAFAFSHVGVVVSFLLMLAMLIPRILELDMQPNNQFISWMTPGFVLTLLLCILPILSLYKTKR